MKTIEELNDYFNGKIQGGFWMNDGRVLKEEIEKLKPGDVYVEIGVDEGKSARYAHEYADPGVFKIYIDIHNVDPHSLSIGRGKWMEQEGMVGIGKRGFFVHGDADEFAPLLQTPVSLLFIDGHHSYEDVEKNTLLWEPLVKKGGVILFHDTDYTDGVPKFLDNHYGKGKWENCHGKVGRVRL